MMIEPRLSVSQLAERWGCSRQHVYNQVRHGALRSIRIGSLLRFRPEDIAEYENRECPDQEALSQPSPSPSAAVAAGMSSGGKTGARTGFHAAQRMQAKRAAS